MSAWGMLAGARSSSVTCRGGAAAATHQVSDTHTPSKVSNSAFGGLAELPSVDMEMETSIQWRRSLTCLSDGPTKLFWECLGHHNETGGAFVCV